MRGEERGRHRLHGTFQLSFLCDSVCERVRVRVTVGRYAETHIHICMHILTDALSVCLLSRSPSTVATG